MAEPLTVEEIRIKDGDARDRMVKYASDEIIRLDEEIRAIRRDADKEIRRLERVLDLVFQRDPEVYRRAFKDARVKAPRE